ncbi:MAG TPA: hypothetical protein VFO05_05320 [Candidatus Limnocylindrales bacterium]|nr:hypothetical protein [Candidatus Limnocylindrales bacterium]
MAIIGGLFAALGRFAGKVVTMVLGWASVLLFGRVPQRKQSLLALITLGSIGWVVALVGVVVPDVGAFLLAAIPRPEFIDEFWIRVAMIAVAIILPLVIGFLTILVLDEASRPTGAGLVVQVLRGYLYAPVLAVTLVVLAGIALWRKGTALAKRWQDAHVAVIVKPGGYERVVRDVEGALADAGVPVRRVRAPAALTIPPKLLAAVGGAAVAALVPDELVSLEGKGFSALVYPSDIALLGEKAVVARARAAIVARLTLTEAYLTSAEETQKVEDRLADLGKARPGTVPAGVFRQIDEELAALTVPYDDWETLYRLRLQVENQTRLPDASEPGTGGPAATAERAPTNAPAAEGRLGWVLAAGVLSLLLADVAVWIGDRRGR